MAKRGRPTSYNETVATAICERVAGGESIRSICEDDGMPGRSAVLAWLQSNADFQARCARAWDLQADALADQQLEVAQGVLSGKIDPQAGRVALSAYQWLGSKRAPKRYGDKINVEASGPNGGPIQNRVEVVFVSAAKKEPAE